MRSWSWRPAAARCGSPICSISLRCWTACERRARTARRKHDYAEHVSGIVPVRLPAGWQPAAISPADWLLCKIQRDEWGAVPSDSDGIMVLTPHPEVAMAQGEDPKVAALREQRSLNVRPERVVDERFAGSEFLDARDLVQVKYEMVRRVRVDGDTVTRSVQEFGFSRPAFYEAQAALDEGGLGALVPARP